MSAQPDSRIDRSPWGFARLVLIAVAIAFAVFLLWRLRDAVMIAFGAVIVAVLLLAISRLLRRVVPLPHRWAVVVSTLLVLALLGGFAGLMGAQVRSQFAELWERLPVGIGQIEERLGISITGDDGEGAPATGAAGDAARDAGAAEAGGAGAVAGAASADADGRAGGQDGMMRGSPGILNSGLWEQVAAWGLAIANAVFGVILVAIGGVYLALDPPAYRRGVVRLFPPSQHQRIDETLVAMGRALHLWLMGTLIAMALVGLLTGVGTWLIGLPAPIALGLFAGLMEFVPVVGPFVGAGPAVLLAVTEGGMLVVWTILLYVGIQQVEANLITPLVQQRMLAIAPAVFLLAVVVFGGVFGILGVIFAAPLAVVAAVAIQKLWMREALHEATDVTGEPGGKAR